jgi:uncharacterized membrane protein YfcA
MGVPPSVSSATGMYMIMFSTTASSVIYILYKILELDYAIWIGLWCSCGSLLGIILLEKINKKLNRQSPIVMVLAFVLGLSAILVPIFGAIDL